MPIDLESPLAAADPDIAAQIAHEVLRQHEGLEMIASENFVSRAVLEAAGTIFTNKYAEGYPGKRYYGGCEFADVVENLARDRAKRLFGADHVNVQPHSGSQANAAAFMTLINPGDTILGLDLAHGGHLTHGHKLNFSGKLYKVAGYQVRRDTETIDYDLLEQQALEVKPKLLIGGGSAYPRQFDFPRMRQIADKCGAFFLVDMAHFAGLVAGGAHPSPVPHAHIVTTTTHKTLRGPRSGLILCEQQFAAGVDRSVFPRPAGRPRSCTSSPPKPWPSARPLSPPLPSTPPRPSPTPRRSPPLSLSAASASFPAAPTPTSCSSTFSQAAPACSAPKPNTLSARAGITVNKNAIPYDTNPPLKPSGIRIGTPALTTRGMKEPEMLLVAAWIVRALEHRGDPAVLGRNPPPGHRNLPTGAPSTTFCGHRGSFPYPPSGTATAFRVRSRGHHHASHVFLAPRHPPSLASSPAHAP